MSTDFDVEKLGFSQRQRLTYIESVAYWEGRIDRPRVSTAFKVSDNHVTKDFRIYKSAFPGNLQYDESARVYRPSRRFRPKIGRGSPDEYLALLKADAEQHGDFLLRSSLTNVLTDAVPLPKGSLDASILNSVTRAISSGSGLEMHYQSKTRDEPSSRKVWPHALVFSGTRWHARAYDSQRQRFIDLVLQRILSAKPLNESSPCAVELDSEWNTRIDVEVMPRRSFSDSQAKAIAREFGMTQVGSTWVWKACLRECLVNYFIHLHRLDVPLDIDPQRVIELRDLHLIKRYMTPAERPRELPTKASKAKG